MILRILLILGIVLSIGAISLISACGDDDDDDDAIADDDDDTGGGVCYYECIEFTNVEIKKTFCYGTGGSGDMATEALKTDAECLAYAQQSCESAGNEFSQYLFDTNCQSCNDSTCEPAWLEDYS